MTIISLETDEKCSVTYLIGEKAPSNYVPGSPGFTFPEMHLDLNLGQGLDGSPEIAIKLVHRDGIRSEILNSLKDSFGEYFLLSDSSRIVSFPFAYDEFKIGGKNVRSGELKFVHRLSPSSMSQELDENKKPDQVEVVLSGADYGVCERAVFTFLKALLNSKIITEEEGNHIYNHFSQVIQQNNCISSPGDEVDGLTPPGEGPKIGG